MWVTCFCSIKPQDLRNQNNQNKLRALKWSWKVQLPGKQRKAPPCQFSGQQKCTVSDTSQKGTMILFSHETLHRAITRLLSSWSQPACFNQRTSSTSQRQVISFYTRPPSVSSSGVERTRGRRHKILALVISTLSFGKGMSDAV